MGMVARKVANGALGVGKLVNTHGMATRAATDLVDR